MLNRLKRWWENDEEYVTHEAALNTWAEMACRINTEMASYRLSLVDGLREEGYQIESAELEPCEELPYLLENWLPEDVDVSPDRIGLEFIRFCHDLLRGIRTVRYGLECQDEADADSIDDTEGELLKLKRNKTREERLKYRKWIRHKKYGGVEVTVDLIQKDDKGWHSQLQTDYFSGVGREFVDDRDVKLLNLLSRNQQLWYPVFIASQIGLKVQILERFKIRELTQPEQEFKNSDPLLQWLADEARQFSQKLRQILGINICEKDSPIAIANKFLKKLGMKLVNTKEKRGPRGGWDWIYRFESPSDGREEVFRRWFERDTLSRNDSAVVSEFIINNREAA
jgi:hypothetical protein